MSDPTEPEWEQGLDDVGRAVAACLADLDHYEAAFQTVLDGATSVRPRTGLLPADGGGWADRLDAAKAAAEAVERLLLDGEEEWVRWRGGVADWERRLQQPPGRPDARAGDGNGGGDPAGGGAGDAVRRAPEEAVRRP